MIICSLDQNWTNKWHERPSPLRHMMHGGYTHLKYYMHKKGGWKNIDLPLFFSFLLVKWMNESNTRPHWTACGWGPRCESFECFAPVFQDAWKCLRWLWRYIPLTFQMTNYYQQWAFMGHIVQPHSKYDPRHQVFFKGQQRYISKGTQTHTCFETTLGQEGLPVVFLAVVAWQCFPKFLEQKLLFKKKKSCYKYHDSGHIVSFFFKTRHFFP